MFLLVFAVKSTKLISYLGIFSTELEFLVGVKVVMWLWFLLSKETKDERPKIIKLGTLQR